MNSSADWQLQAVGFHDSTEDSNGDCCADGEMLAVGEGATEGLEVAGFPDLAICINGSTRID